MDFRLNDEEQLIVQTVRRFADSELRAIGQKLDEDPDAAAERDKLVTKGGDLGFFLDAVPEAAGGLLAGDYSHTVRALRGLELGRGCPGAAAVLEANVEPALAAARFGDVEAQKMLFASLAAGELATTAHDSTGRLSVKPAGTGVVLDGVFGPVPVLGAAKHLLLSAATEKREAMLLLVPTAALTVTPIVPAGWRAGRWGRLECKAVQVPRYQILARGEDGAVASAAVLTWLRVSLAARAIAAADQAMRFSAVYGQERIQFGQPIGTFESLARLQDANETAIEAGRLLVLRAAAALDGGDPAATDLASRARDFASGVVRRATIEAVQIYGGYGFVRDFPVEKLMRDARAFEAITGEEALARVLTRRARA